MIAMRCHKQKPQLGTIAWAIFAIALAPAVHAAQPYTAEAMWQLKRLADPAISPDGRLAVVPVTKYDMDENKGDTDLWLVPTKPGKARQLTSDRQRLLAGVEPGRRADRLRLQARRRQDSRSST